MPSLPLVAESKLNVRQTDLVDEPIDRLINVFFTINFVDNASGYLVCVPRLGLIRLCSQEPIAAGSDSIWAASLVERLQNCASRYHG